MTVPFTLRNKITPDPQARKGIDFLHFIFVGEQHHHTARFVGGVTDQHLVLTDERTKAARPVTDADLDRPMYAIGATLK